MLQQPRSINNFLVGNPAENGRKCRLGGFKGNVDEFLTEIINNGRDETSNIHFHYKKSNFKRALVIEMGFYGLTTAAFTNIRYAFGRLQKKNFISNDRRSFQSILRRTPNKLRLTNPYFSQFWVDSDIQVHLLGKLWQNID